MSGEDAKRLYDTRRSWLVCASSFLVQFIIFGVHSSYGIFFVAIQEEFQERESATGNPEHFTVLQLRCWMDVAQICWRESPMRFF